RLLPPPSLALRPQRLALRRQPPWPLLVLHPPLERVLPPRHAPLSLARLHRARRAEARLRAACARHRGVASRPRVARDGVRVRLPGPPLVGARLPLAGMAPRALALRHALVGAAVRR